MIDDLWYKNAIIYCLDVEKYLDSNGDGIGDFGGLTRKLDYLAGLGVTCLWLQPFYPSPNKDNGYDVADYYGVHPKHGTLGEFVEFMNHAEQLGMRVIVDLVVNHTSDRHPWFQAARKDPESPYRDWYVWSKKRPPELERGHGLSGRAEGDVDPRSGGRRVLLPPLLRLSARPEHLQSGGAREISASWASGCSSACRGFRMDAVPFLIEKKGAGVTPRKDYELLHEMRDFLQWRRRDAILLAEANVPPDESLEYFGELGDRLQMMLNFPVNQRLFYALATGDIRPLVRALEATYERPQAAQWVNFLRSHDELDLGRLTTAQRAEGVRGVRAEQGDAALRPRHPPAAGADARQRSPAARAGVQPAVHAAGHADAAVRRRDRHRRRPVAARARVRAHADAVVAANARRLHDRRPRRCGRSISDPIYGYQRVNVEAQRRDPQSLVNWIERKIRMRKECPEISWGDWRILDPGTSGVLVMRYDWRRPHAGDRPQLHRQQPRRPARRVDRRHRRR